MKYPKSNRNSFLRMLKNTLFCLFLMVSCKNNGQRVEPKTIRSTEKAKQEVVTAAQQTLLYFPHLQGKRVGLVTNQTGVLQNEKGVYVHLVDSLLQSNIEVVKVFAPEHGFRGDADAGEIVKDGKDAKTGLPIISLYGKNKKPTVEQLQDVDVVLFDIQDVGVRFYTYISTLHYVMEACAEQQLPLIVLDRPNPNGHYIDGPVLQPEFQSFVGMHPVPVVYGMTIGEYAQMINGEKWLANEVNANLKVIPLLNYTHQTPYSLPVKPSPNLPNDVAVNLYPSLCFFEGTNVSVGRGTDMQFQIYGSPYLEKTDFSFVPKPNEGEKKPKYNGVECFGENLQKQQRLQTLDLSWLIKAYEQTKTVKTEFFNIFFNKLAGDSSLKKQLIDGVSEKDIREKWQPSLSNFKEKREQYLLYD